MSSKVDTNTLVETYRELAQNPSIVDAEILNDSCNLDFVKILSKWNQRNIERGEIIKFQKHHMIKWSSQHVVFESVPVDITQECFSRTCKSGKLTCIVKEVIQENKRKTYIEIWNQCGLFKNFDVNAFDVHGDIYCDGEFGSLEWSPNEDKVIYIAEKKARKTEPFYKQKAKDESKNNENKEGNISLGCEFMYKPDWGEQLVGKHQPVVGICDLASESLSILDGIPSNFSPGQVLWAKDGKGIYGVVFENEPRRLGLIYCTNRLSYIFHLNFKGDFKIISDNDKSVRSPRLSLDGNYLFWLQRPKGGAHHGCQELVKLDLTTNKKEVLIGIVKREDKIFSGLYLHDLPTRCFSKDGTKLFFSTLNKTRISSYYLDLETNVVNLLETGEGSSRILDVHEDIILISTESFQKAPSLKVSKLINDTEWIPVTKTKNICQGSVLKEVEYKSSNPDKEFSYYNALYYGPSPPNTSDKTFPLIVYPHGGPHGAVFNAFSLEFNFFVSLGCSVLAVNYRGSTGCGQDGVDFLRGKLGNTDVKEVHESVLNVLEMIPYLDPKNIFLYGRSYGGFLVSQLSGQYPDFYRAVVNGNGVSDLCSMYTTSDIPDWAAAESGFDFDEAKTLTMTEMKTMLETSPVQLVDKIKIPTFFIVGKNDLRVPFSQGVRMYHALKARNIKVRLNMYESNHTLSNVPVHIDSVINSLLWFLENKL